MTKVYYKCRVKKNKDAIWMLFPIELTVIKATKDGALLKDSKGREYKTDQYGQWEIDDMVYKIVIIEDTIYGK